MTRENYYSSNLTDYLFSFSILHFHFMHKLTIRLERGPRTSSRCDDGLIGLTIFSNRKGSASLFAYEWSVLWSPGSRCKRWACSFVPFSFFYHRDSGLQSCLILVHHTIFRTIPSLFHYHQSFHRKSAAVKSRTVAGWILKIRVPFIYFMNGLDWPELGEALGRL